MAYVNDIFYLFGEINGFLKARHASTLDVDQLIVGGAIQYIDKFLANRSHGLNALHELGVNMQNGQGMLHSAALSFAQSSENTFALALKLCGKQIEVGSDAMLLTKDDEFKSYVTDTCVDAIANYFITLGSERERNNRLVDDLGRFIIERWRNKPSSNRSSDSYSRSRPQWG